MVKDTLVIKVFNKLISLFILNDAKNTNRNIKKYKEYTDLSMTKRANESINIIYKALSYNFFCITEKIKIVNDIFKIQLLFNSIKDKIITTN